MTIVPFKSFRVTTYTFLAVVNVTGYQRFLGNRSNIGLGFVINLIGVSRVTGAVIHGQGSCPAPKSVSFRTKVFPKMEK